MYAIDGLIAEGAGDEDFGDAMSAARVERHLVGLERAGKSQATRHLVWRTLRTFGRFAMRRGIVGSDPLVGVSVPKYDPTPRAVLEDTEVAALLRACSGQDALAQRDTAIVRLLLGCGLRRGEVAALNVSDWDKSANTIRVRAGKTRSARREVFIPAQTEDALYKWSRAREAFLKRNGVKNADTGPLFIGLRRGAGEALPGSAIRSVLVRRAKLAGLTGSIFPHRLRHSYAHAALSAGLSDLDVATSLGHRDTSMLVIYGSSHRGMRSVQAFRALDRGGR